MKLIRRSFNKILSKYTLLRKRTTLLHDPLYMMVEPTNYCTLSCPLCPTGNGTLKAPKGFMKYECYKHLISEMSNTLISMMLWGFGEPFLHPDIFRMFATAHKAGIVVKTSTNGQTLNDKQMCNEMVKSGLDQLRVSLDGLSDKTLQIYRIGATISPIIEGLHYLLEAKKRFSSSTPNIIIQFIVMKHNEHELPKLKELANKLGVIWKIKTVSIGDYKHNSEEKQFIPESPLRRYIVPSSFADSTRIIPKSTNLKICPYPWLWAHVNWDGTVVPCCKDPHRNHTMGNAFENGFMNIWNNESFVKFRKTYLKSPKLLTRCKKCDYPFNC